LSDKTDFAIIRPNLGQLVDAIAGFCVNALDRFSSEDIGKANSLEPRVEDKQGSERRMACKFWVGGPEAGGGS